MGYGVRGGLKGEGGWENWGGRMGWGGGVRKRRLLYGKEGESRWRRKHAQKGTDYHSFWWDRNTSEGSKPCMQQLFLIRTLFQGKVCISTESDTHVNTESISFKVWPVHSGLASATSMIF